MRPTCCILLIILIPGTLCEVFSSLGHMEDLIRGEAKLINALDDYIQNEKSKLEQLVAMQEEVNRKSLDISDNFNEYLSHPINQFKLMNKFMIWKDISDVIKNNPAVEEFNDTYSKIKFPQENDVNGAVEAIIRLQDTYLLTTHDLANGNVEGSMAYENLTLEEIFYIGLTRYEERDYYHCALWMNVARSRILAGTDEENPTLFQVLDHLSYCLAQQGNMDLALELSSEMLKMDPENERTIANHERFTDIINARKAATSGKMGRFDNMEDQLFLPAEEGGENYEEYERLCRDGSDYQPEKEKELTCFYWTNENPWLFIQPVKAEVLSKEPVILRFYEIASDNEIERLISIAKPLLNRATVGRGRKVNYRVSKSAWLGDTNYTLAMKLTHRISAITGLNVTIGGEKLQMANYGIGGHYEPHLDYFNAKRKGVHSLGDRIATWMFYFSDVPHGGHTVFIQPKLSVQPIKGTAVFWYNLLPSGFGDERTRHGACPVLYGIKWAGNKWIHEQGQEFIKKCGLTYNAQFSI